MCTPAVSIAVSAAQSLLQMVTAQHNTAAMRKYGDQMFAANKALAEDDAIRSYAALQARQQQEHAKAAQAIEEAYLTSQRRESLARVGAAEGGVGGQATAETLDEFKRVELNYQTTVIRNRAMLDANFQSQGEAVRAQEQGRILQGLPAPIANPDYLGIALSGFANILKIQASKTANSPMESSLPSGPEFQNTNLVPDSGEEWYGGGGR